MSSLADVNVHICGKEIIKYDLEIKALVQVSPRDTSMNYRDGLFVFFFYNVVIEKESSWKEDVIRSEAK